jgi:hypothetical protein
VGLSPLGHPSKVGGGTGFFPCPKAPDLGKMGPFKVANLIVIGLHNFKYFHSKRQNISSLSIDIEMKILTVTKHY